MITFDTYALDNTIDERIERAFNIWDRYGKEAFDDDYRLVPREVYDLQDCHLLSIIQEQQEQITELRQVILANASMTLTMADKLDMKPEEE